jgi:hypothetical protein
LEEENRELGNIIITEKNQHVVEDVEEKKEECRPHIKDEAPVNVVNNATAEEHMPEVSIVTIETGEVKSQEQAQ